MVLFLVVTAVVATAVGVYLFLRNNPKKKSKVDDVVDNIKNKLS